MLETEWLLLADDTTFCLSGPLGGDLYSSRFRPQWLAFRHLPSGQFRFLGLKLQNSTPHLEAMPSGLARGPHPPPEQEAVLFRFGR